MAPVYVARSWQKVESKNNEGPRRQGIATGFFMEGRPCPSESARTATISGQLPLCSRGSLMARLGLQAQSPGNPLQNPRQMGWVRIGMSRKTSFEGNNRRYWRRRQRGGSPETARNADHGRVFYRGSLASLLQRSTEKGSMLQQRLRVLQRQPISTWAQAGNRSQ